MRSRSTYGLTTIAALLIACRQATDPIARVGVGPAAMARGGVGPPTCSGMNDCAAGPAICTGEDQTVTVAPAIVTDYSNGVSSDGRGPYVQGRDGVLHSVVLYLAALEFDKSSKS